MLIIPAIDLINGKCVRLTEGDFSQQKIYDNDPLSVAYQFKELGAQRIHVIDLDGAKTGNSINRDIIKQIKRETALQIETGGGIRTEKDVKELLDGGIDYLILGTILATDLIQVEKWIQDYSSHFIAGIDAKNHRVQTSGWKTDEGIMAVDLGKKLFQMGFSTAIYTDISRDGKLKGANVGETIDFAQATSLKVILSGGITSNEDIAAAYRLTNQGIIGVIIGKAFYEKRINLKKIINQYQE